MSVPDARAELARRIRAATFLTGSSSCGRARPARSTGISIASVFTRAGVFGGVSDSGRRVVGAAIDDVRQTLNPCWGKEWLTIKSSSGWHA